MKFLCVNLALIFCIFSISLSGFAEIDPTTIVAGWLFDEGKGKITADISGDGHDGEIQGAPKWVDGKFGKALEFDGAKDWIDVPEIGTFEEITACVWAQYTGRVGQFRVIFNNNGWVVGDVHHQIRPANELVWAVNGTPGHLFSTIFYTDKEMNKWHHFATVYSTKQKLRRYYINGEENKEDDNTVVPGRLGPARIGSWDGGDRNWIGFLDELVFFNVALTKEDITQVMEGGFEKALSVQPQGKLATKWGVLKSTHSRN